MWSKDSPPPWGKLKAYGAATPYLMIEIIMIVAAILGLFVMAKARRAYLRGAMEEELLLSTLAGKDVISDISDSTVDTKTWVSSCRLTWALSNLTEAFSQGPITVGLAHSDYTDAEIEEFLEQTASWTQGNLPGQEIARRKIRVVGTFDTPNIALGKSVLNEGKPITTKCGFLLQIGDGVRYWAYNNGSNALATTSAELTVAGHANLWPR